MRLFDFKWAIVVFLFGVLTQLTGAFLKIRHWPMADEFLTLGYFLCAAGVIFAIIKIVLLKKPKP